MGGNISSRSILSWTATWTVQEQGSSSNLSGFLGFRARSLRWCIHLDAVLSTGACCSRIVPLAVRYYDDLCMHKYAIDEMTPYNLIYDGPLVRAPAARSQSTTTRTRKGLRQRPRPDEADVGASLDDALDTGVALRQQRHPVQLLDRALEPPLFPRAPLTRGEDTGLCHRASLPGQPTSQSMFSIWSVVRRGMNAIAIAASWRPTPSPRFTRSTHTSLANELHLSCMSSTICSACSLP